MSLSEVMQVLQQARTTALVALVRMTRVRLRVLLEDQGPHVMAAERELQALAYPAAAPVIHMLTEERVRERDSGAFVSWATTAVAAMLLAQRTPPDDTSELPAS